MNKTPFFSILTPVYNVEKFLSACVDSVLAQTFSDWELILVDDGSTDRSGQICDAYAAKFPEKIRVFHKPNEGLLKTRRFAFSKAQGPYYVILDSDDALVPETLQTLADTFRAHDCDCVVFGVADVENGQIVQVSDQNPLCVMSDKRAIFRKVLLDSQYNALWRKSFKAACLDGRTYGEFSQIAHGEDLLQSLEILRNSQKVVFIPQALYLYNKNLASITHKPDVKIIDNFVVVTRYVLDFMQQEGVFLPQDFEDLREYYVSLLEEKIKYICRLPFPFAKRRELLETLRQKNFLTAPVGKGRRFLLSSQLNKGWYRLLIGEVALYTFLNNLTKKAVPVKGGKS